MNTDYISETLEYRNGGLYWRVSPAKRVKVGDRVGYCNPDGYRHFEHKGRSYKEHRVIWQLFNGSIPEGMYIDHINRVKDDNRIENLRLVTHQENCMNKAQRWTQKTEDRFQEELRKRDLFMREQCLVEDDIKCGALLLTKSGRWNGVV